MHVSSNANNGTNAGTFCVNANNSSTNANRNIGTQLAVIQVIECHPLPERANMSIQYSLVGQPKNWEITSDEAVWKLMAQDY